MDGLRLLLGPIVSTPWTFTVVTALATVILVLILTRTSTSLGVQNEAAPPSTKAISTVPYMIPWIGHTWSFARGDQMFLARASSSVQERIFAIILRGRRYIVITALSLVQQLQDSNATESSAEVRKYKLRHFFGYRGPTLGLPDILATQNNDKIMLMENSDSSMTDEIVSKVKRALEQKVYNLVSFNESWIDQSPWERTSKTLVRPESGSVAEASFFPLIDSFLGELVTTVLLGRNFLENNADFVDDFRLWDSRGTSFMNRVPAFLPQMSGATAARERVLRSLRDFYQTLSTYMAGREPGIRWGDLSDVSSCIVERLNWWRHQKQLSLTKRSDVSTDLALLWALNKPNTLIAWLLYRVYSDAALLAAVRKDIEPFVQIEQPKSELSIPEPPKVTVDTKGLIEKSTLLRAAMDETIRLDTNTITYGAATKDVVLTESREDVIRLRKSKPDTYVIHKGEHVCLPYRAVHHGAATLQDGPGAFNPGGFSSVSNPKAPSSNDADAVQTNAFGVGATGCPGKAIAETETMNTAATILMLWEVQLVDEAWVWPGQKPGLCSMLPARDVRVKLSRRKQPG